MKSSYFTRVGKRRQYRKLLPCAGDPHELPLVATFGVAIAWDLVIFHIEAIFDIEAILHLRPHPCLSLLLYIKYVVIKPQK